MQMLESYLKEHPFLKNIEPQHIKHLAECATNVQFNAKEYIFREGNDANFFYIIRHGRVAIQLYAAHLGSINIQTLESGDILGWSWFIPPYKWHFDAFAVELTRAVALDGKCLRAKCEQNHDLGYELFKRFSLIFIERLQSTRLQLLDIYKSQT